MSLSTAETLQILRQWQSETAAIREAPEPKKVRVAVWVLAALLTAALGASPFVRMDRVVTSERGRIVTTRGLTTFQALDSSIIKTLDAKEGQQVRKGQVLATLDPTFASAEVGQLRQQIAGLDAQIARAEAEQKGEPLTAPPGMPIEELPYVAMQRALYDQRAAQLSAQTRSFDEKIKSTQATIAKLEADDARYQAREKISHQVEDMRGTLFKSGASSYLSLLQANDSRLEMLRLLENGHNGLIVAQHQLSSLEADRDASLQQWSTALSQELVTAQNQRDTAVASLEKATRHQDLVRLVAPDDAVVLSVSKLSVGSVLKEGDQVMSLAPLNSPLEAEVHIAARDIGFVRPGDPVSLKIDAYNFYEHGMATGRLNWISEGAFTTGEDGQPAPPFYKARVSIADLKFADVPDTFRLIPGMTLTADVKVGTRSAFGYIMGGFFQGMGEEMRGP